MSETAKKRWMLLVDVLRRGRCQVGGNLGPISVRRFASFGLLATEALSRSEAGDDTPSDGEGNHHIWYKYTSPYFSEYSAIIRHLDGSVNINDLLGFNNTGNVCVWPAEEILTYYCLQRKEKFRNKKVCELGGGMTCLAGVAVATYCNVDEMLLTDGNEQSVKNCDIIIEKNKTAFGKTKTWSSVLRWDEYGKFKDLVHHFDIIIMADCFFFDDFRKPLVKTLDTLLKPGGEVISFAPSRGGTFKTFENLAAEIFSVKTAEKYDDHVWQLHQENKTKGSEVYDENIHYPMLMEMTKLMP